MRNAQTKTFLLLAASLPLAACSSIFGSHHLAGKLPEVRASAVMAEAGAAPATVEGRRQLDADRPGAAIESFQKALATGEPVAPAINGLGVAYARLGRFDLARRFFEEAMAADPRSESYAANLTRLMRSPVFAMRHDGDLVAAALAKEAVPVAGPAPLAAADPAEPSRIQRVSRGEVRIATSLPPAPRPVPPAGRVAMLERFTPSLRIPLAPRSAQSGPVAAMPARFQRVSRGEVRISGPLPIVGSRDAMAANGAIRGFSPAVRISLADPRRSEFRPQVRIELARPAGRK